MKYIEPITIARIKSFKRKGFNIKSEGFIFGSHTSLLQKGFSQEFAEYRSYAKGDNIRFIDWKVYARNDRLFIKEFSEEKVIKLHIVLDASNSMAFQGSGSKYNKWEYSARFALAVACFSLLRGDLCGLFSFSGKVNMEVKPQNLLKHLMKMDSMLCEVIPQGTSFPPDVFKNFLQKIEKHSILVIFSDLMMEHEKLLHMVRLIGSKKIRTYVFHVMDSDEINIPWSGAVRFKDMEADARCTLRPDYFREIYKTEFSKWLKFCKTCFTSSKMLYFPCITNVDIDAMIAKFLTVSTKS